MMEEINKWLVDHYGTTIDGRPLFRIIWSTNLTEKRYSEFHDYSGDLFIRAVRETREVLKYPFAQDRFVLERLAYIPDKAREMGLITDDKEDYIEVYTFQDKNGDYLPLRLDMVEAALFLFFKFYLGKSFKERADMRTAMLEIRDKEKRNKIREALGEGRSPFGFVLE